MATSLKSVLRTDFKSVSFHSENQGQASEISVYFRCSTHDFQKLRKETSEIEALPEGSDVGFPSVCCEYVLLPLLNKEAAFAQ